MPDDNKVLQPVLTQNRGKIETRKKNKSSSKQKGKNLSGIFSLGKNGINDDCDGYCGHGEFYGAFHAGDGYGWRRVQDLHVVELEYGWSLYAFLFMFFCPYSSFIPLDVRLTKEGKERKKKRTSVVATPPPCLILYSEIIKKVG